MAKKTIFTFLYSFGMAIVLQHKPALGLMVEHEAILTGKDAKLELIFEGKDENRSRDIEESEILAQRRDKLGKPQSTGEGLSGLTQSQMLVYLLMFGGFCILLIGGALFSLFSTIQSFSALLAPKDEDER